MDGSGMWSGALVAGLGDLATDGGPRAPLPGWGDAAPFGADAARCGGGGLRLAHLAGAASAAALPALVRRTLRDLRAAVVGEAGLLPELRRLIERRDAMAEAIALDEGLVEAGAAELSMLAERLDTARRQGFLRLAGPGEGGATEGGASGLELSGAALERWRDFTTRRAAGVQAAVNRTALRLPARRGEYEADRAARIAVMAAEAAGRWGVTWAIVPGAGHAVLPDYTLVAEASATNDLGEYATLGYRLDSATGDEAVAWRLCDRHGEADGSLSGGPALAAFLTPAGRPASGGGVAPGGQVALHAPA